MMKKSSRRFASKFTASGLEFVSGLLIKTTARACNRAPPRPLNSSSGARPIIQFYRVIYTGGGALQHEDAYAADARVVESYLAALHAFSEEWLRGGDPRRSWPIGTPPTSSEILEMELLSRWRRVLASLPRGTMSGYYGYGSRQLQYLGLVVKEVLNAKEYVLQVGAKPISSKVNTRGTSLDDFQANFDTCSSFFNLSTDSQTSESMENLIYLLSLVLRQARDQVNVTSSSGRRKKRSRRRGRRSRAERNRSCAKAYYERSVDLLVDVVRRDRETAYLDLDDDVVMAKTLLKWLYFGKISK